MANIIGKSIGRYHILEQLGQGGMATVYKAYDTRLEREVAIKLIRKDAFPAEVHDRVLQRFDREAKSLAKLSHPNIVKVHDYGEYEGAPYLVMELIDGGSLKEYTGQPIPYQEAAQILLPIARALAYAHERKILHRDIKPGNILISESGESILTDFGIAKLLENSDGQTLTGTNVGVGTPEYMAPEQGLGKELDGRADIYSLGIVLFELLTGTKPYQADTPFAVLLKQVNDPLPRPKKLVPNIPDEVEKILFKALAKASADRYQTMDALRNALENLIGQSVMMKGNQHQVPLKIRMSKKNQAKSTFVGTEEKTQDNYEIPVQKAMTKKKKFSKWIKCSGIAVIILLLVFGIVAGIHRGQTISIEKTQVAVLTKAALSTQVAQTAIAISWTVTPVPDIGSTQIREKDGMVQVYVPAGEFHMGSDNRNFNEQPEHIVYLNAFWIDQTEITNQMYEHCVDAKICVEPNKIESATRGVYFGNPGYANYPVIYVDWNQAKTYCEWVHGSLPTEAEWEKAARGTDGRLYPWGNTAPANYFANNDYLVGDTVHVGQYLSGKSPYGALDMAGNVWEWVFDMYGEDYYQVSEVDNPRGPSEGQMHILRGGSWVFNDQFLTTTYRKSHGSLSNDTIGFRCVNEIK